MKGIDTLKFLFSLVVVWIHTGVGDLGGLTPWAVPFFFLASGFFLFGKLFKASDAQKKTESIASWWHKTLRLYLLWSLIFLPFAIIGFANDHLGVSKSIALYLRNLFLVGENYLSWPLWYLLGLLWAGFLIWLAGKLRLPFWSLCVLAVFLFFLPRLLHLEENEVYLRLFKTTRNGLFVGFPFMVLGGLIRRILPGTSFWGSGSWQQKTAFSFRYLSTHIYLTHMLWAGLLILIWGFERSLLFWGITCSISIVSGLLIRPCGGLVKFLYGSTYQT